MSRKEREEAEKQFKSIRERKPFKELRQAAKTKPIQKAEPYGPKIELYKNNLRAALEDEEKAGPMYRDLAAHAKQLSKILGFEGYIGHAITLEEIAKDEARHYRLVKDMLGDVTR